MKTKDICLHSDAIDFKGVVTLIEDGKEKWQRPNKIGYLGRAYLLKMLTNSLVINGDFDTKSSLLSGSLDRNAFICACAFGSGGNMESGTILPVATKYTDTCLYNIEPFIAKPEANSDVSTFKKYVDINNLISPSGSVWTSPVSMLLDENSSLIRPDDYLYFKRMTSVSDVFSSNISTDLSSESLVFNVSFITFEITISMADFMIKAAEGGTTVINEMGLYLGSLKRVANGLNPLVDSQDGSGSVYQDSHLFTNSYGCTEFVDKSQPIMFSHLTFPSESFKENRTLTFKYSIYV